MFFFNKTNYVFKLNWTLQNTLTTFKKSTIKEKTNLVNLLSDMSRKIPLYNHQLLFVYIFKTYFVVNEW